MLILMYFNLIWNTFMKRTSSDRVRDYRESQKRLGRKKREAYLTDEEWFLIKAKIADVKRGGNGDGV